MLLLTSKSKAQCEIKTFVISDNYARYSMKEEFFKNEDLENGVKMVYVFANSFREVSTKKVLLNSLVVSYFYSFYQSAFTPSQIVIYFTNGTDITMQATEKSTNTINQTPAAPSMSTIEGIFELTHGQLLSLLANNISAVYLYDIKKDISFNITPKYKSVFIEMLTCVNK